ncbi:uncharacterized protein BDZ99DRAFT_575006 [Mytilinidion resinicola]|uniref:Cora-domain-containing protein n=1 Tax=Mytilinidion resinicola TaxID=574789 RepID=A0A6A6Y858_9PEZI|nr:uncharacterized protein BDZ99DRAFT_575006 [Mytilinidion resinicola]KAF2804789.1 hypothetical protein BDZ99DRAFT_575006 [Mytilinidion resinicola]
MGSQFSTPVANNLPPHPWQQYTYRNEGGHHAEDGAGRLFRSQNVASRHVIDGFITHRSHELERPIPRRYQIVKDFLSEAVSPSSRSSSHSVEHDIAMSSLDRDFALVDDRCNATGHSDAGRRWEGDKYKGEVAISEKRSIPHLHEHLKANRLARRAEKRLVFIPNPTPAAALALVSTVPSRTAIYLRSFLCRYLRRENLFGLTTMTGLFILEFHIPYYAIRHDKDIKDPRQLRGKHLRESVELPLRSRSRHQEQVFYHESQISGLFVGPDEWVWTTYFLLDTFFGSEDLMEKYLANCPLGEGFDPPLSGGVRMDNPHYNPREYLLAILDRRIWQIKAEWSPLIETFDERMEAYAIELSGVFEDDPERTHTRTLNGVIRTIQRFMSVLNATVDSWRSFKESRIPYFTSNGNLPTKWQGHFERIEVSIIELGRLCKGLSTKLDLFREIQAGLSRASSLKESAAATQTARSALVQGENIRLLTRMTVYIYLPVMFTLAFFSMPFARLAHPWTWPLFFLTLLVAIMINYVIASNRCCVRRALRQRLGSPIFTSTV